MEAEKSRQNSIKFSDEFAHTKQHKEPSSKTSCYEQGFSRQ
jgi:hypothetical protein